MWQKLIACACVMTGAVGFGYAVCREMSCEIQHLKLQKQIVSYMTGEITYLRRPMEEVLDIISERVEAPYDTFLEDVSLKMKERNGMGLRDLWKREVDGLRSESGLSDKALNYLEKMAGCFGCEGDLLQVEALGIFERELDVEIDRLLGRKEENGRLIRALSALVGIFCIVFFL